MIGQKFYLQIKEHFGNDKRKAIEWFVTPNTYLGGDTPFDAIRKSQTRKVTELIKKMVKGDIT